MTSRPPFMQPSDEDLMERIAGRDHGAFSQLVVRHMRRVVSLAQTMLRRRADADEVAQEIFLRVWERPHYFDPAKARFTTWLHRATVNLCIDKRRAAAGAALCANIDELPNGLVDDAPDAMDALDAEHRRKCLRGALDSLPERQRTAILLFYVQGLSQREAAETMALTVGAYESLLQRARRALCMRLPAAPDLGFEA